MQDHQISRRNLVKTLTLGVSATSILSVIPLKAAHSKCSKRLQPLSEAPGCTLAKRYSELSLP